MTLSDPESVPETPPGDACDGCHKNLPKALQSVPNMAMTVTKMTSERTQAYGRVIRTLEDLGPAKLLPAEQDRIRDAADNLIFAADIDDARDTLADIEALGEHLVSSGRWSSERAEELVADLAACGPVAPVG